MPDLILREIVTGGQDGVDLGALVAARRLGIKTGGVAPRGYRTARGPDRSLANYGLTEHSSSEYPPRTEANVVRSDGTLLIATDVGSRGTVLTRGLCEKHFKPCYVIDLGDTDGPPLSYEAAKVADWVERYCIRILNVAGNHKQPGFHQRQAEIAVELLVGELRKRKELA
jgi:Circularly permutated YpsA SLOG family